MYDCCQVMNFQVETEINGVSSHPMNKLFPSNSREQASPQENFPAISFACNKDDSLIRVSTIPKRAKSSRQTSSFTCLICLSSPFAPKMFLIASPKYKLSIPVRIVSSQADFQAVKECTIVGDSFDKAVHETWQNRIKLGFCNRHDARVQETYHFHHVIQPIQHWNQALKQV
ncbi:hypothetical protein M5689_005362 [Euphorbia peplus]|nr:hypothetical protein M5689_005362 [Euphorbia peplus]